MTPPKKIYISNTEAWESLVKSDLRSEYISVEWLEKWINEQSNEDSTKSVLDELLKAIKEE